MRNKITLAILVITAVFTVSNSFAQLIIGGVDDGEQMKPYEMKLQIHFPAVQLHFYQL